MEIKLIGSGIGASIPKINFGFNIVSGVYIQFRDTPNAKPLTLGIAASPEVGGSNGALIASYIVTDWAKVDSSKHPWLCSKRKLLGKTVEVEFKGTLVFGGKVDIAINVYDENNEKSFSLEKIDIEASGGQLTDTKIRGKLVDMSGKLESSPAGC